MLATTRTTRNTRRVLGAPRRRTNRCARLIIAGGTIRRRGRGISRSYRAPFVLPCPRPFCANFLRGWYWLAERPGRGVHSIPDARGTAIAQRKHGTFKVGQHRLLNGSDLDRRYTRHGSLGRVFSSIQPALGETLGTP